jgi:hypothetical protein
MSAAPRNESLQENLLADTPQFEQKPEPPAVWPVVRFILKSPMQCSRLRSSLTLSLGILSSVLLGASLAAIGALIGQLINALKDANEKEFDRWFLVLSFLLVAAITTKTCSEYFMRSLGQLKRSHLNSRIQTM